MKFLVIVKVPLLKPFAFWKERFEAHRAGRQAGGIEDLFAHPVIGEQAVVYTVKTTKPRAVHDMIYDPSIRPMIEESGFAVGREVITVCEWID